MSTQSSRLVVSALVALVALALAGFCEASSADPLNVALPEAGSLSIAAGSGSVRAWISVEPGPSATTGQRVNIDTRLTRELRLASEVVSVGVKAFSQDGYTFLVLGVSTPSVVSPGSGYCGAGTEDVLLLVEWKTRPPRLVLRDRIQVQSCLQSMELRSDQGNELSKVLHVENPAQFTLDWLLHPRYGSATKTLSVASGKFALSPTTRQ